jgi:hypothetical protein
MYKICIIALFISCGILQAGDNAQVKIYSPKCEKFIRQVSTRLYLLSRCFGHDPDFKEYNDSIIDQITILAKLDVAGRVSQQQFNSCSQSILNDIPRIVYDSDRKVISFKVGDKSIEFLGDHFDA